MIIGKAFKPRCLKTISGKQLWLVYQANSKAWTTSFFLCWKVFSDKYFGLVSIENYCSCNKE